MTETMMTQSGGYGGYHANGMAGQQPHMDFSQLPGLDTSQAPGNAMSGSPSEAISAGGTVRRAAPEPNKRALYVGGLDQRVTEEVLNQIFTTAGPVQSVKIIPDKNFSSKGLNYGFVEYEDSASAEKAMQSLNGRRVLQNEIKVNWAYQSNNTSKEDTSQHFHIFVGDLSNEVNDEVLLQAFGNYGNVSEARVMWDMKTGRSRGYGFVAFRDRMEADKALNGMNGEFLGSRAIRCNWANQKGQPSMVQSQALTQMGMAPVMATTAPMPQSFAPPSLQAYQTVHAQSPPDMTTIWVGNITPYTTQNDLLPFFSAFGQIQEMRFHSDKGFAFVKMDTHENATNAICTLNGHAINGKPMRVNWGTAKDQGQSHARPATAAPAAYTPFSPQSAAPGYAQSPGYFPQYAQQPGVMAQQHAAPSPYQASPYGQAPAYGQPAAYGQQPQYAQPQAYPQYQAGAYSRAPAQQQYGAYPPQPYGAYGGYQQ